MKNLFILTITFFIFSCAKNELVPNAPEPSIKKKLVTTVLPEGSGKITPTTGSYDINEKVQISATPIGDFVFKEWQNGLTGSTNPTNLLMDSDKSVVGVFEAKKYLASKFYEKHTTVNQKTGWYQTNKSFVGNFWIDSSLAVRNIYVDKSGKYQFGNYIPNIQGYFSNRQTLLYTDLNGDGKNDVMNVYWPAPFGTNIPGYYATWEFDKNGFTNPKVLQGLTGPRKLVINDYFGNNKKSVLVASFGMDANPWPGDYNQIVSFDDQLNMSAKNLKDVIGAFHSGASADLDNDGDIDIILYGAGGVGPILYENTGSGNFKMSKNIINGFGNSNDTYYFTFELFDVNLDGYIDIVLGGEFGKPALSKIFWGNSSHTFDANNQTIIPELNGYGMVEDFAFSDIDNDSDIDLILLSSTNSQDFYLQITENTGNKKFENVTTKRVDISKKPNSLWFGWIRVFDIDNDGDQDLVGDGFGYFGLDKTPAENQKPPKIYWTNDGKGNYTSNFSY